MIEVYILHIIFGRSQSTTDPILKSKQIPTDKNDDNYGLRKINLKRLQRVIGSKRTKFFDIQDLYLFTVPVEYNDDIETISNRNARVTLVRLSANYYLVASSELLSLVIAP